MSDPIGGAAKAATEMLKEVQQAMQQVEQLAQTSGPQAPGNFQNVLNAQQVTGVQETQRVTACSDVLRAGLQNQRAPGVPSIGRSLDRPAEISSGLKNFMNDVMAGQDKMHRIMEIAMSGKNFSSSELLMLQAGVYRFTQELELTSKVVEKGTSAIKQTLNTQV